MVVCIPYRPTYGKECNIYFLLLRFTNSCMDSQGKKNYNLKSKTWSLICKILMLFHWRDISHPPHPLTPLTPARKCFSSPLDIYYLRWYIVMKVGPHPSVCLFDWYTCRVHLFTFSHLAQWVGFPPQETGVPCQSSAIRRLKICRSPCTGKYSRGM